MLSNFLLIQHWRYDTIGEFNADSKVEQLAESTTRSQKKVYKKRKKTKPI